MSLRAHQGQAAVELVAVLPLVLAVLAAVWQVALAGHAWWAAAGAAEASARAAALGHDPRAAAVRRLPAALEHGLRVRTEGGGGVKVTLRIPSSFGLQVGTVSARARFVPQR